jgi:hypothetical protein
MAGMEVRESPSQSRVSPSRPTKDRASLSGPSRPKIAVQMRPMMIGDITTGTKKMARKTRQPCTRSQTSTATSSAAATCSGTASAKRALLRRAMRKVGSRQTSRKLSRPT